MMRKQLLALVCCFLLALSFVASVPVETLAAEDEGWSWTLEDGCLTISGEGEMLRAWRPWEKHSHEITSVIFEEGVTYIAFYAFSANYENLKQVTLPRTLETVGAYAFSGCQNLQKVNYRGGLKKISQLEINEGNDYLLQTRWVPSAGWRLLQALLGTGLTVIADLLLVFFIYRRVQKRRMRLPRDFSEVVNRENL